MIFNTVYLTYDRLHIVVGEWSDWTNWFGCHCHRQDTRFRMCFTKQLARVPNCRFMTSDVGSLLNIGSQTTVNGDIEFEEQTCPIKTYRNYISKKFMS